MTMIVVYLDTCSKKEDEGTKKLEVGMQVSISLTNCDFSFGDYK